MKSSISTAMSRRYAGAIATWPLHPKWARSLRDQCVSAGVHFFFKQWGEYWPWSELASGSPNLQWTPKVWNEQYFVIDENGNFLESHVPETSKTVKVSRFGKKSVGRLLDGQEWINIQMFNAISLGTGVQSSTMALMANYGKIEPMPDCAIFADTQAEPEDVYQWLKWLIHKLDFDVHTVMKGNLEDDSI